MLEPYCYPDTNVLKNKLGIRDYDQLQVFERRAYQFRFQQLQDRPIEGQFDLAHLQAIHGYLFQDVYEWAGMIRTIDLMKPEPILQGASAPYSYVADVENDAGKALVNLVNNDWSQMNEKTRPIYVGYFAAQIGEVWRAHPFREGNTRTTITFAAQFAKTHGFEFDPSMGSRSPEQVRNALIGASMEQSQPLAQALLDGIEQRQRDGKGRGEMVRDQRQGSRTIERHEDGAQISRADRDRQRYERALSLLSDDQRQQKNHQMTNDRLQERGRGSGHEQSR